MASRLARGEVSDEDVNAKVVPVVTGAVKHQVEAPAVRSGSRE